jgi:hypothetical protein
MNANADANRQALQSIEDRIHRAYSREVDDLHFLFLGRLEVLLSKVSDHLEAADPGQRWIQVRRDSRFQHLQSVLEMKGY